jgi:hypothetical protein
MALIEAIDVNIIVLWSTVLEYRVVTDCARPTRSATGVF